MEDMHRLYANTIPFYIKDLSTLGFLFLLGEGCGPVDTKGQLYIYNYMYNLKLVLYVYMYRLPRWCYW